jgi:hypothetical protein
MPTIPHAESSSDARDRRYAPERVYAPNDETDRRLSEADALLGARGYVRGRECPDEVTIGDVSMSSSVPLLERSAESFYDNLSVLGWSPTDRRLSEADALLGARGYVRGRECPDEVETAEPLRCRTPSTRSAT